jgi:hypothetical protein
MKRYTVQMAISTSKKSWLDLYTYDLPEDLEFAKEVLIDIRQERPTNSFRLIEWEEKVVR